MANILIEGSLSSDWGKLYYQPQDANRIFPFPYHIPTKEIYNLDIDPAIRFKCVLLTFATPIVSVLRFVYWMAKAFFLSIGALFCYVDRQPGHVQRIAHIKESFSDSGLALKYGAAMTYCALAGILKPFKYRCYYGELERELNRQPDGAQRNKYYLAFCFQRLAVVPDPTKVDQDASVAEKLDKFIKRVQKLANFIGSSERILNRISIAAA